VPIRSASTVTSDLTIRAIAPGGFDYASRFTSIRSEIDGEMEEYRNFAQQAVQRRSNMKKTRKNYLHVLPEHLSALVRHGKTQDVIDILSVTGSSGDEYIDQYGNTLLIVACQNNRNEIAEYLLQQGANVNAKNFSGNTSLHYACKFRYSALVDKLIKIYGADTSMRDSICRRCSDKI
jgi:ankyrin repeat protein